MRRTNFENNTCSKDGTTNNHDACDIKNIDENKPFCPSFNQRRIKFNSKFGSKPQLNSNHCLPKDLNTKTTMPKKHLSFGSSRKVEKEVELPKTQTSSWKEINTTIASVSSGSGPSLKINPNPTPFSLGDQGETPKAFDCAMSTFGFSHHREELRRNSFDSEYFSYNDESNKTNISHYQRKCKSQNFQNSQIDSKLSNSNLSHHHHSLNTSKFKRSPEQLPQDLNLSLIERETNKEDHAKFASASGFCESEPEKEKQASPRTKPNFTDYFNYLCPQAEIKEERRHQ